MEYYRVVLVDDEEEIRKGISRTIQWEDLGFQLVGEAENGIEALEKCEQLQPDVVLTDIKMPFLDGLALCKRLRTLLPAAKYVIFSGFDDFEYARQAVGVHASEYILKPIGASELRQVLADLKGQLDQQRGERRDVELLRARYEESLPILRELFYVRLLDGCIPAVQVSERVQRYEIDLPQGLWSAVLIHVDGTEQPSDAPQRNELILLSVKDFFQEQFALQGGTARSILYNDTVALLITLSQEGRVYALLEELGRVRSLAYSYLGFVLTIGVGRCYAGAETLHTSAVQARSALDYRVLNGTGRVIYIGDMEPDTTARLSFDEEDERALTAAVKLGDEQRVTGLVQTVITRIREGDYPLSQCRFFFLELVASLIKLARSEDVPPEEVFGANFSGSVQLSDFNSPEELGEWFRARCLLLQTLLGRRRSDSAWRTIEQAKDYITGNYGDSALSIDALCGHLHLSPSYFSTLFKRETGMSFTTYVTSVRMEAAANLLRQTDEKTYLIAERTGYLDPNYFSYVFRRHFGLSPSKFRAGNHPE